jgi:transcriptional regulator with XRE-family HTH domain
LSDSSFAERLAYARWLYHLRTGSYPSNAAIAAALDVTPPWVTKWSRRADAPDSRQLGRALCQFLGVREEWLLDDAIDPPEPALWKQWNTARAFQRVSSAEPAKAKKRGAR